MPGEPFDIEDESHRARFERTRRFADQLVHRYHRTSQCNQCGTVTQLLFLTSQLPEEWPLCSSCGLPMVESPFHPVSGDPLKEMLKRLWSPVFGELGLESRQDNAWVEPGDTVIRKMVLFRLLKGGTANAAIGLSLGFIPTPGRNELVYHRTQKSAQLDFFQWHPPEGGEFPLIRLCNPLVAERTLTDFIPGLAAAAREWFAAAPNLDAVERLARERVEQKLPRTMYPSAEYVLAFVEAARGNFPAARVLLQISETPDIRQEFHQKAFEKARAVFQ